MDSLPSEILVLVFRSCDDLAQTLSLASSCRHLHRLWLDSRAIWAPQMAQRQCLALEEAIQTVNTLTPKFNAQLGLPPSVSFLFRKSVIDLKCLPWQEIVKALNMDRVAARMEKTLCPSGRDLDEFMFQPDHSAASERRTKFYRKLQRLLHADPIVAGEYVEICVKNEGRLMFASSLSGPGGPDAYSDKFRYGAGSGDFLADAQRRMLFRQFLDLLGRCVLQTDSTMRYPSPPVLRYSVNNPQNRAEALQTLKILF